MSDFFEEIEVTLIELLNSRESRVNYQKELLGKYKEEGGVLISVTLNIPGPVKDRLSYRKALREGMERLREAIPDEKILYSEVRDLKTGSEGYLVVREFPIDELKKLTVNLEETLPLGRLYDMDVLDVNGGISRSDIGSCRRKCFICGDDAKVCARSQKHSMEELLAEIDRLIEMNEENQ